MTGVGTSREEGKYVLYLPLIKSKAKTRFIVYGVEVFPLL